MGANLKKNMLMTFCDRESNVYDFPGLLPAFRTGKRFTQVHRKELIKLPYGGLLFSLPERYPVSYNPGEDNYQTVKESPGGEEIWAASAFLSSGYLRTYLPAYERKKKSPLLPLWAYCGVVTIGGKFYVPALRIDDDPRSDPKIHENDPQLEKSIKKLTRKYPANRLVKQLSTCSREYRCLCSRNFFLGRFEAPIPTSPSCNAFCMGCLSFQKDSGFSQSQYRLGFKPSPEEISQVILHHFEGVNEAVASFGQGCEGEPLIRAGDLAKAIAMVRGKTGSGTINLNTNGSRPDMVKALIESGLDSIRISLNSPTEKYYTRYFRPRGFSFSDVKQSLEIAIKAGIFTSINLFFLPGFTDMAAEAESLLSFLGEFPVNMIQTRNLNIDPDFYLEKIGFEESEPMGIRELLNLIMKERPLVKLGYYNPPKERF